jgi:hypothetical protein
LRAVREREVAWLQFNWWRFQNGDLVAYVLMPITIPDRLVCE